METSARHSILVLANDFLRKKRYIMIIIGNSVLHTFTCENGKKLRQFMYKQQINIQAFTKCVGILHIITI